MAILLLVQRCEATPVNPGPWNGAIEAGEIAGEVLPLRAGCRVQGAGYLETWQEIALCSMACGSPGA